MANEIQADPHANQAVQAPPVPPGPETQPMELPRPEAAKATSASRRVRARLARRMTSQRSTVSPVLEPLVAVHREIYPKADLTLLQKAYEGTGKVPDESGFTDKGAKDLRGLPAWQLDQWKAPS